MDTKYCPFNCYNTETQLPAQLINIEYTPKRRIYICKKCGYKVGAFKKE